jgi:hypothetical protein
MTLGRFAGARSHVFLSHTAQILGGYRRQQTKSSMKRSPLMATQICHGAVILEQSAMEQANLEQTAMEQAALRPPWSRPPWSWPPGAVATVC